jgi:hypothetical protein
VGERPVASGARSGAKHGGLLGWGRVHRRRRAWSRKDATSRVMGASGRRSPAHLRFPRRAAAARRRCPRSPTHYRPPRGTRRSDSAGSGQPGYRERVGRRRVASFRELARLPLVGTVRTLEHRLDYHSTLRSPMSVDTPPPRRSPQPDDSMPITRTPDSPALPVPIALTSRVTCCGPTKQSSCCAPTKKAACCGSEATTGGGCECT